MNSSKKSRLSSNHQENNFKTPIPNETEIECLLTRTQPKPSTRFYKGIEKYPWNRENSTQYRFLIRPQSFPIIIVLIAIIFVLAKPSLDVVANRIAKFFISATQDRVTVQIPLLDFSQQDIRILSELTESNEQVGFEIKNLFPSRLDMIS